MSSETPHAELGSRLRSTVSAGLGEWMNEASRFRGDRLLGAFVGAQRRAGRQLLADTGPLAGPSGELATDGWSTGLALRVWLLLASQREGSDAEFLRRAYREGDSGEKTAVVCALGLIEAGDALLELALDAGRTNELDLFERLACGNPFPARFYPELEFNKLVMKAAFSGLPLARIAGLQRRANAELARMAMEYVDERQAAGRSLPADIWLAMSKDPPVGAVARMIGALYHAVAEQRLGAALGLSRVTDARSETFLRERLAIEKDERVAEVLDAALKG
jgi:hypothetical protein